MMPQRKYYDVRYPNILLEIEKSTKEYMTTQQDRTQKQIRQENNERKRRRMKQQIFVKWGRGKREANGK